MRNLKRALSLALASVMLLGMMVVGTSASYADVDHNDNVEAIEILNAAEVMVGDDKGNFNPDQIVTRAEMSVIISKLLYGSELSVERFADVATFSDVPAWAQGYVNLCASLGIVSGVGGGKFDPQSPVTTAQAALMLLRALEVEVEINANTDYKVAAMTAAEDADLFEDMAILAANAGLTRNNVAQMTLNAMLYNDSEDVYVVTDGTSSYEFDDMKDALLYSVLMSSKGDEQWNVVKTKDYAGSLIDEVFEITVSDGLDAYGRPATAYDHDDWAMTRTYGETADYTFVITGDTNLYDLIEDQNLTKKINNLEGYKNELLTNSQVVELFVDNDKNLTSHVAYRYFLMEITDIEECDEDDHEDAIEDGAEYVLTLAAGNNEIELFDINIANFDEDTYVEGAMLTWAGAGYDYAFENLDKDYDFVMIDTEIADEITGKVTAIGKDFVRVDGVKYTEAGTALKRNDEGTFYLDPNNFILGFEETEEEAAQIDDVIMVIATFQKSVEDEYGAKTYTTYAQVMNLEGEVENLVVAIEGDDNYGTTDGIKAGELYTYDTYTAKKVIKGINYKGTSKLTAWTGDDDYYVGTIAKDVEIESKDGRVNAAIENKGFVRLHNATNYIMIEGTLGDVEIDMYEGGINTTTAAESTVIATKSGANYIAQYIIMPGAEIAAEEYDDVIYVAEDYDWEETIIGDDEVEVYAIPVYDEAGKLLEGEDCIYVESRPDAGFYTYSIDDNGVYELEEVKAVELTGEYDDESGVIVGTFHSVYEGKITLNEKFMVDIETADAAIIDLHDDDTYSKNVKTLKNMEAATEDGYTVSLAMYVDDGAVLIVVTDVAK